MITMGIGDWRAKRNIKYPERGVLRVIGLHDGHSRPSRTGTRIAGIITAPGVPATRIEHKMEDPARWTGHHALPVLLDRTDPAKFVVLWEELESGDWQDPGDVDPQYAGAPSTYGPSVTSTITTTSSITIGPDGRPINVPLSPEAAARVQSALGKAFGSGRGQVLGRVIGEVVEQALGQATGQPYGQGSTQPYGQGSPQPYGQPSPAGQPFGQAEPQAFNQPAPSAPSPSSAPSGQAGGQPFGQVDPQAFSQPFGQVDPQAFRSPDQDERPQAD